MKLSGLLVAWLFVVALTSVSLVDAKKKKKSKAKKTEPVQIGITRQEYCDGCITTLEQFNFEISDAYQKEMASRRKGGKKETLQALPMLMDMCGGKRFESFTSGIKHACLKLHQDAGEAIVRPFAGSQRGGESKELSRVQRNKHVCVDIGACQASQLPSSEVERTPCAACKALTTDMELLLRREAETPDHADSVLLLHSVCSDVAMRHPSPAYLESYCEEWVDEMEDTLSRVLSIRQRMLASGLTPSQSLEESVCGPALLDVCEAGGDDHMEL